MSFNRNSMHKITIIISALFASSLCVAQDVEFERDVAPILEEHCWHCHGEDEQESALRLDQRVNMLAGGDSGIATIVPGEPEKSYLIEVVNHVDEDMAMPPDEDKLSDQNIDTLKRWIKQGANWPGQMDDVAETKSDHWSFKSVTRPAIPKSEHESPVDAFLLQTLNESGLTFSQPADPQTLIRRASIVLTGIAPTPAETFEFVDAFNQDSEKAYADLVDRLLESPHFGERWAQHWLDVIRWAETNGSEANLYRKNAWIYRDYVVRAFNEDKPYDQFVREQIAGDSLGMGEATGFLVAGPHVPAATVGREPTAIRQARADRLDEVMQTVGASVMGVTIGCARCHNHKFDPISIKDYYAMTAVFQDVEFGGRFPEFSQDHPRRQRGKEIWAEIGEQRTKLREMGGWEENWGAFRELHFKPTSTDSIRIQFKMHNLGLDELEVFGTKDRKINLADARLGSKVSSNDEEGVNGGNPVTRLTDGEFGTMAWRVKFKKDDEERPWVQIDFDGPVEIERLRLSNNREYFYDTDYLDKKPILPRYEFDMSVKQGDNWQPWVETWIVNKKLNEDHPQRKKILAKIQSLIEELAEEGPRPSFVGRFVKPDITHVLLRGSPENPRDEVMPAGPVIFDGDLDLTSDSSGSKRRAEFATWITNPENPLTSRVMVNRIWHHVFGMGIVPTTSDFGKAGALPSHPELLDWLASEFIEPTYKPDAQASASTTRQYKPAAQASESTKRQYKPAAQASESTTVETEPTALAAGPPTKKPWSTKSMIRLLVMSDAFRQSSAPVSAGLEKDSGTALLWRFPPKRVEAEVIRDSILQASGALDRTIGGRSFRIHNEKQTYAQWEVLDNHGPGTWRRMLYQERMRRVDDQIFTAFDFPDCGQVRAKRPVSTTPLQALNLMNSDFVIEQSNLIAERAEKDSGGDTAKSIDRCFELLLCRSPTDDERDACLELANANDLALVCRALINTNEFAFLP